MSSWGEGPGCQQTTDFLIYSVSNFQPFNSKALKLKVIFSCEVIVSMASKYFILISGVFFPKLLFQKLVLLKFQFKKKKALPITPILSDCCFCKTKFRGVDKHAWIKQLLLVWDFFSEKYSHGFYLRTCCYMPQKIKKSSQKVSWSRMCFIHLKINCKCNNACEKRGTGETFSSTSVCQESHTLISYFCYSSRFYEAQIFKEFSIKPGTKRNHVFILNMRWRPGFLKV